MLYKKNSAPRLSKELFENPTSEYRCTPFWAWNCELKPDLLLFEIERMKEMGFGGFHMHSRVGLATPYMKKDFMDMVKLCVEKAKQEDMLAWLYDEDKWPSGFAGGEVTKNIEYRQKILFITSIPYNDGTLSEKDREHSRDEIPESKYYSVAAFDVELDKDYCIKSYKRIGFKDEAAHEKWFAYVEYVAPGNWYNGQTYADTLDKKAIDEFIKVTHEVYKEAVGDEFGKTVPSIFTDEPEFFKKKTLAFSSDKNGISIPYTTDLEDTFKKKYGVSLIDSLPELVWELPDGKVSQIRYFYHDHVAERFAEAFADNVGAWCDKNGIALTGHMMEEPTLTSQTAMIGDAMRSYRSFTIPGIDMLADGRELTTAKQAQSAVHQYGKEGMLSELYGCTNWVFDFRGHKLQGDWQAALGVTVRVPHLFWVSMSGEAKRDYPACIGYQSPWYSEYKYIEDHFARINTVMTRGVPVEKIAVIHPVESYWLHWGPSEQTSLIRSDMESRFNDITKWLLLGTLDFDFVCESNLPAQYKETDKGFTLGVMNYDAVVVPYCETIRSTTLDALEKFADKSGKIIIMGKPPVYVDAVISDRARKLAEKCTVINWSRAELFAQLEPERQLEIRDMRGHNSDNLIYQLREDGQYRHLFISHVYKPSDYDTSTTEDYYITIRGEYKVTELETLTGGTRRLKAEYKNGNTVIYWPCAADSSILLELESGKDDLGETLSVPAVKDYVTLDHTVKYQRQEQNVLTLDFAEYSINGGARKSGKDVLQADDDIRQTLGIRRRGSSMKQPWLNPYDKNPKDRVSLYFSFGSTIEYEGASLALESLEYSQAYLNGEKVDMTKTGFYVDIDAISTVNLPKIKKGMNELRIDLRFGDVVQIENYFILGNFGVNVRGNLAIMTDDCDIIGYGDITSQGMPFYGGNIRYYTQFTANGKVALEISSYKGSAVIVDIDGERAGIIAFPPHRLELGEIHGTHVLELTLLGNRMNTFGATHNVDRNIRYCGPGSWRRDRRFQTDDYMLAPTGIMTAPRILIEE